jgi:hypothetical protein
VDNHNEKKCLEVEGIIGDGKRTIRKREADFYGMIMGVRTFLKSFIKRHEIEAQSNQRAYEVCRISISISIERYFLRTFLKRFFFTTKPS